MLQSVHDPPWSVQVRGWAQLSLVAILRGDPWVVPGRGDAVRLPGRWRSCAARPGRFDGAADRQVPDAWAGRPAAAEGTPAPLVLANDSRSACSPLVALLADEIVKDEPGQEVVLDRLVDLLLVAALRAWFARPDATVAAVARRVGDWSASR